MQQSKVVNVMFQKLSLLIHETQKSLSEISANVNLITQNVVEIAVVSTKNNELRITIETSVSMLRHDADNLENELSKFKIQVG